MPFLLTKKNIEDIHADAKVIGACPYRNNSRNQGWHPDLWAEQRRIQQLSPGESLVTTGAEFEAKCGIVTMPPIWEGGERKEGLHLACCYDSALRLAHRRRCRSVAFPLLSADCHGFPKDLALKTALTTIRDFLEKYEITVYLSVREPSALRLFDKRYEHILEALELENPALREAEILASYDKPLPSFARQYLADRELGSAPPECAAEVCEEVQAPEKHRTRSSLVPRKLEHLMAEKEETFSQSLLRLIDRKGLKDPEVYKKANLDRRLFSKIRSNANYQPSKATALALALALELNLDETRDLLGKAGFALSHSSQTDIIVEYFIREQDYDIYEINQVLFTFDQPLLGS